MPEVAFGAQALVHFDKFANLQGQERVSVRFAEANGTTRLAALRHDTALNPNERPLTE